MAASLEDAQNAIYEQASKLAPDANAEDLVKLADAVGKVAWGPQGGHVDTDYRYDALNRYEPGANGHTTGFTPA